MPLMVYLRSIINAVIIHFKGHVEPLYKHILKGKICIFNSMILIDVILQKF